MTRWTALAVLSALALVLGAAALPLVAAQDGSDSGSGSSDGAEDDGADGDSGHGDDRADDEAEADDRGRDEEHRPEKAGPERREVRVDVVDHRAELRSEVRDGDDRNDLRMELRGEDATLSLDFENRTDEGRIEVAMSLRFAHLVEFRDADGDGVRDPGEATVQSVDLRGRTPAVSVNETAVGPRVTSTYGLPGNGTFEAEILLPSGPARVGPQNITPEEAKIDFVVDDFPFQANGTRLDLQVEVDAAYEARGSAADASGVTLPAGEAAGYFRWLPNATVDGAVRDVGSRVDAIESATEDGETETQYVVHMAYAQGDSIVHDPTFGVQSVEEAVEAVQETLGHLPTYVIVAGGTAVLALGIAYARTRRGPV